VSDKPSVGKEILNYCSKCDLNLSALIVSMLGAEVSKVMCKTCKTTRRYKDPKGGATSPSKRKAAGKSSTPRTKRTVLSFQEVWREALETAGNPEPKPYSIRTAFDLGQVIEHPTFGVGIIQKRLHPDKIQVIFQDDERTLIHNR